MKESKIKKADIKKAKNYIKEKYSLKLKKPTKLEIVCYEDENGFI